MTKEKLIEQYTEAMKLKDEQIADMQKLKQEMRNDKSTPMLDYSEVLLSLQKLESNRLIYFQLIKNLEDLQ